MGKPNPESLESLLRRCRIGIATLRPSGPDSPTQKIHREDRRSKISVAGVEEGITGELLFSYDLAAPAGLLAGLRRIGSGDLFVPCGMARCFPPLRPASSTTFAWSAARPRRLTSKASTLRKRDAPIPWSTNCPPLRSISGHASTVYTKLQNNLLGNLAAVRLDNPPIRTPGAAAFQAERRVSHRVECVPQGPRRPCLSRTVPGWG